MYGGFEVRAPHVDRVDESVDATTATAARGTQFPECDAGAAAAAAASGSVAGAVIYQPVLVPYERVWEACGAGAVPVGHFPPLAPDWGSTVGGDGRSLASGFGAPPGLDRAPIDVPARRRDDAHMGWTWTRDGSHFQ